MRCVLRAQNGYKCVCGRGLLAYSAPPDPSWIFGKGKRVGKGKEGEKGRGIRGKVVSRHGSGWTPLASTAVTSLPASIVLCVHPVPAVCLSVCLSVCVYVCLCPGIRSLFPHRLTAASYVAVGNSPPTLRRNDCITSWVA